MNRLLLILATISVAAVVLMFAPNADAGGYGFGNQVFVQASPFGYGQQVFVQRSFVPQQQVFVQHGFGFQQQAVFVRPQVQVNVNRGFGFFPRRRVQVFVR